jgi:exopolysaccharide production protein ExoQ
MSANADAVREEYLNPRTVSGLAFAVGAFFSARTVFGLLFVRVLGTDPRTAAEITIVLGLLLLAVVCFNALGAASRTFGSMLHVASIRWVFFFLAFSLCSLTWSVTVSLSTSLVYWGEMAADVTMVILLFRAGPVTEVAHSLMKGFIWSACCLALIAWLMPAQSDLRLGDEDLFNTNQIGNLCAFAIFLCQYLMRRKDGKWWGAAFFLTATLLRSLSKTTLVAFLASESFLIIQDRSMSRKTKVLLTIAVMSMILVFWGLFEAYYDVYTTAGNSAETLTGRTWIWTYVWNEALQQPWIGHGFDSMWKVIPPFGQFEARHAENEVLTQFYLYGAAGIVMLVGLYGSFYAKLRKLSRGPLKIVFFSLLIFIVVRGLAEAEPFDFLLPLWMIVLISMLADCRDNVVTEDGELPILNACVHQ